MDPVETSVLLTIATIVAVVGMGFCVAVYLRNEMVRILTSLDVSQRPASERPLDNVDRMKDDLRRDFEKSEKKAVEDRDNPERVVKYLLDLYGPEWSEVLQEVAVRMETGGDPEE